MNVKALLVILLAPWFSSAKENTAKLPEPNVYWQESDQGDIHFYADNLSPIPYWVEIKLDNLKHLQPSKKPPFTFIVGANRQKSPLFSLKPRKNKRYSYNLSSLAIPGLGPNVKHQNNHIYNFPFSHGKKYRVGQGYFGTATHHKPSPYALDFNMDQGQTVCAARDGIVVEIKQDSNIGGEGAKYAKHGNHIIVYHQDGTFANYVHLQRKGALVRLGDQVKAGQPIGLSGNTGQSSGPHLHFEVFKYNANGQSRNLPVQFLNYDQSAISKVEQGQFYYATHRGKAKFKPQLGESLKNSDFATPGILPFNDIFEISTTNVDDTVAIFANNGKKSTVEIELTLKLDNLSASRRSPLTASIAPLSKQFLLLLKPINPQKPRQYGYSIKQQVISPEIDDNQYNAHRKPAKRTNNITIRRQQVDDKILLYASNGYNATKRLTITLNLSNMKPSRGPQQTIEIPPLTEVYLQHVKPRVATKDSQLGWALKWY